MPSKATIPLICQVCDTEFLVPPHRKNTAKACSTACSYILRGRRPSRHINLICPNCLQPFDVPKSHVARRTYCSRRCQKTSPEFRATCSVSKVGEGNPMWKGGVSITPSGYRCRYVGRDHPFVVNCYLLEHRWVMENHLREKNPESPFLVKLGDNLYLSPDLHVHHKDGNRVNNHVSNLECMTPAEHARHHDNLRK